MEKVLKGKSVAVLVETEYIHREIEYYKTYFSSLGAKVDFLSYLHGAKERKLICDITDADDPQSATHTMFVTKDIGSCNPNDYDIILCGANYVAVRLREIMPMGSLGSVDDLRTAPAVRFFAGAMMNKKIVKGCLCHALWILTPCPELLKGRKVICHTVVLSDIHNAGGIFVPDPSRVVVDNDLVTGRSSAELELYTRAIVATYKKLNK